MNKKTQEILQSLLKNQCVKYARSLELKEGEYTIQSYGECRSFDSEGDMYEYIHGRRSKVIDEFEGK